MGLSQGSSSQQQGQDSSLCDLIPLWSFPLCHTCFLLSGPAGQRSALLKRVCLCGPCGPKGTLINWIQT